MSHYTTRALIRRELLCVFSACYSFAAGAGPHRRRLWGSVRRELGWPAGLIFLASQNLGAAWSQGVLAVDASSWGGCIVQQK
eukprot:2002600-Pyramimonas_sp.AAC.1